MLKLICFDLDGVIFEPSDFWVELHRVFGTSKENEILAPKYLRNNFPKLVEEVLKLWKGKDAQPYFQLVKKIKYHPGVKKVFSEIKRLGYTTAIISGSSIELARRAQQDLGIDHIYANDLVIKNGKVEDIISLVGPMI
ncbi:HAD-IB family phosphatase [Candidatus Woesearchaeota archaeon]|nr:HAD-IB family phosphatase [Candidatus Woesearchaeota archaeon]